MSKIITVERNGKTNSYLIMTPYRESKELTEEQKLNNKKKKKCRGLKLTQKIGHTATK